jgi:hypothetical protein
VILQQNAANAPSVSVAGIVIERFGKFHKVLKSGLVRCVGRSALFCLSLFRKRLNRTRARRARRARHARQNDDDRTLLFHSLIDRDNSRGARHQSPWCVRVVRSGACRISFASLTAAAARRSSRRTTTARRKYRTKSRRRRASICASRCSISCRRKSTRKTLVRRIRVFVAHTRARVRTS